jgi:xylulose-5-phosphate/fructose-6-phosphate phosphoketolase
VADEMIESRRRHREYIVAHGEDLPEVRDWRWEGAR